MEKAVVTQTKPGQNLDDGFACPLFRLCMYYEHRIVLYNCLYLYSSSVQCTQTTVLISTQVEY
jgi:hypothetical protein